MAHKARHSQPASKPAAAVVLFGIDENGKPKAARFRKADAALATKAAKQLHLRVLSVVDPTVAALTAKLPTGRIYATGRGVVPNIRSDLYTKLVAAAGAGPAASVPPPQPPDGAGAGSNGTPPNGKTSDRLPKTWDEITVGHLVVAQETDPGDGWYEAIVVEQNGDIFTLRWRDWQDRRFTRHRRTVALKCPNPQTVSAPTRSARPDASAKAGSGKTASSKARPAPQGLPTSWNEIDVGHLVLAKDDGPSRSWWEAIPTERHGDAFILRWRDYAQLSPIERGRTTLALLCPTAK